MTQQGVYNAHVLLFWLVVHVSMQVGVRCTVVDHMLRKRVVYNPSTSIITCSPHASVIMRDCCGFIIKHFFLKSFCE